MLNQVFDRLKLYQSPCPILSAALHRGKGGMHKIMWSVAW